MKNQITIILIIVVFLLLIIAAIFSIISPFINLNNSTDKNISKLDNKNNSDSSIATDNSNPQIIGGNRDSHGCLGPAGYSWNETLDICLREWEIKSSDEREAIKIATAPLSFPVTLISVEKRSCDGCYDIDFERNDNRDPIVITLVNWTVSNNNNILNISSDAPTDNTKTYCRPEQRGDKIACTMDYNPVCGFFNSSIKCFKYPCANTYSNGCGACADSKVEYYIQGECP